MVVAQTSIKVRDMVMVMVIYQTSMKVRGMVMVHRQRSDRARFAMNTFLEIIKLSV